ncbi:hypothetical protein OPQ81_008077 [Rhizoctonia solani]|nr:hypothetical protein OPQ81_008077 [Rhizoctonia solani]
MVSSDSTERATLSRTLWLGTRAGCSVSGVRGIGVVGEAGKGRRDHRSPGKHCPVSPANQLSSERGSHSRGSGPNGKENPSQEQLGVDIRSLDKEEQRKADDGISNHGHEANTKAIRDQAPERTGDQGHQLVDEAEGADDIAHAIMNADQISNDKRNTAVQKHEEGDGEERKPEKVADGLSRSCGL